MKQPDSLLVALFLWNPLMLILLTRSVTWTIVILFVVLSVACLVSRTKSLRVKVWAFNLCALTSIACHAELLFREFLPDKNVPNLYELHGKYYFNKPNLELDFRTGEYASIYKTNCQGYRMGDLSNTTDSIKSCDWLFIGDSFTQGAQVSYDELYSTQIYRFFPDKIVVNAGISGAGLYDELNYFKDKGKQLTPKVVFLQIGVFNDFFHIREKKATFQDYLMESSDLYRYFTYNLFSTEPLPLGRWTEPFFPTEQLNVDYNILYRKSSETKEKDIQAFKDCLSAWKKETESMGAQLVLFLIPSKEQISPQLLNEVRSAYHISMDELDLDAPNRLFRTTAKSLDLPHYDLTEVFRYAESFPFFNQDEHLNKQGHTIIAQALHDSLYLPACDTKYISSKNTHDRYPTYYPADSTLLYQSQEKEGYKICKYFPDESNEICITKSFKELVHPVFSPDLRYLAYTEGNQESHETDVILYDNILKTAAKLNPDNHFAAIPMFNHRGDMIAFPLWSRSQKNAVANIVLFDVNRKDIVATIKADTECWRPVFSSDDKSIYYIQKEKYFSIKRFEMETEKVSDVLSVPYDIWDIAISPSGNFLVYAGNKDGNWDLFSLSLATQKTEQLTHTRGDEWDPAFGATDHDLWFAGTFGFDNGIYYRRIHP